MARRGGTTGTGPPPDAGVQPDLLHALVASVDDHAIFALGPEGDIATWNTGAERLTGYRADEIVGRHVSTLYEEVDVAAGLPARDLAAVAAGARLDGEGWRVRKDGSRFWAEVTVAALRADDDRLRGFGTVLRDRTERRAAEEALHESEERFRLLVGSVQDYAIFLLDPSGVVVSWNVGAERLKGYAADEIVGQHFSRFYTPEDRERHLPEEGLGEALAHGRWENEGWRVRNDGTRFWADVVITALHRPDGTHDGFAKVTRDLTDRKRNEDRLRELDRMKTDLVAMVAHDLRAPMNVVRGLVHLLQEGDVAPDERATLLGRVAARVDVMADLVDEAFDLARIEAGELAVEAEPFDLVAEVTAVVADASADGSRTIRFDATGAVEAVGDRRRTRQVLANVVDNACKFSPPDTPIVVTVGRDGDHAVVSVADHGLGIEPADRERVFDRYVRLRGRSAEPGGGLGLFIARSLVEAQGGRIWIEATDGGGATFRFTLPAVAGRPA